MEHSRVHLPFQSSHDCLVIVIFSRFNWFCCNKLLRNFATSYHMGDYYRCSLFPSTLSSCLSTKIIYRQMVRNDLTISSHFERAPARIVRQTVVYVIHNNTIKCIPGIVREGTKCGAESAIEVSRAWEQIWCNYRAHRHYICLGRVLYRNSAWAYVLINSFFPYFLRHREISGIATHYMHGNISLLKYTSDKLINISNNATM